MGRRRHAPEQIIAKLREAEIERAIAEENPEMKRGDVFELVQEWLRLEDDLAH